MSDTQTISHNFELFNISSDKNRALSSMKFIMNPIRLLILNYISRGFGFTTSELRKILDIPWATFNDHLKALTKKALIELRSEFVNEKPAKIVTITYSGLSQLQSLGKLLSEVIQV
ncbi:MAG: helix-turn-helix transcriptional regulator [Candidatus Heimdallarchaeota archaeon]|nr:helix-turn-helix transcriptional regulator [Candidatus Heimdallarchaeota archaeon]